MTVSTTALSYNGYVTQVATLAVLQQTLITTGTSPNSLVTSSDPNFQAIIPQMLNYAELRIQRDLDFLATQNANSSYSLTSGNNSLTIPTSTFVTLQTIYVTDANGNVTPLLPVTKEFLRNVYGSASGASTPLYFAVYGGDVATGGQASQNIIFGPWPDANYSITISGTTRQPTLNNYAVQGSADTTYTFISQNLPDIMLMASMIYISAYQRNFGRINDDPAMAQTYESQYQALLKGAMVEEARKKFQSSAWTSYSPSPVASPTRG
jgi:hypothetical protein